MEEKPAAPEPRADGGKGTASRKVTTFERYLLVLFGHHKRASDVPAELPRDLLTRTWEKMRIGVNLLAIGGVVVACYFMMRLGRRDLEEGKSYEKKILEWHDQVKKEHEKREGGSDK